MNILGYIGIYCTLEYTPILRTIAQYTEILEEHLPAEYWDILEYISAPPSTSILPQYIAIYSSISQYIHSLLAPLLAYSSQYWDILLYIAEYC